MLSKSIALITALMVLINAVKIEQPRNSNYIMGLITSRVMQDNMYNSNFDIVNEIILNSILSSSFKVCFKTSLSDRDVIMNYEGKYLCNQGEFNAGYAGIHAPLFEVYKLNLEGVQVGKVEVISYDKVNIDIINIIAFVFMMLSFMIRRNYKSEINRAERIHVGVFLKNKKKFPIRIDNYIYVKYNGNYCLVHLKNDEIVNLRCSLDALESLLYDSIKIKRNIIVSPCVKVDKTKGGGFLLQLNGKTYEL
ncbi:hypothetical protein VII00023_22834 [Vibrio ichthyoenteri ATCC 700023]|uniref:Uncharacterized protein n=1 Tax=Vibrio ichthyoenteri ATCC 700023 TaxID=870968 RepID=F9S7H2_9VIBR|nr:LytTR family transcriptional regulator [Vibrio ichthyoenteri]EGU31268.1 hypothetical protein VII00023_22834 [Vibrio ichthyoenteri ATCC 700023]